jgi:chorismate synthase
MTASTTLGGRRRVFAGPTLPSGLAETLRRAVAFAMASLVMSVLIGALVAVSLGLGYEAYSSPGPDRPPTPAGPAPAPPPVLP